MFQSQGDGWFIFKFKAAALHLQNEDILWPVFTWVLASLMRDYCKCVIITSIMFVVLMAIPTVAYLVVRQYRFKPVPMEMVNAFMKTIWDPEKNKSPGVIMHRGGSIETPENTLLAIHQAKNDGCCGVEIDVDFTKDGVGVLLHDSTVDRTTDGTGKIADIMFTDVQKLNAAAKHKNSGKLGHVKIPTLVESIDLCLELDLTIFLDCKGDATKTADLVCKLCKEKPELYKSTIVCSFYPQVIYAVRKRDISIMTALTYRSYFISRTAVDGEPRFNGWKRQASKVGDVILDLAHATVLWYYFGTSFFLLSKDSISKNLIRKWQKRNIQLIAWTVNHPVEKNNFLHYLDVPVITDGHSTSTHK